MDNNQLILEIVQDVRNEVRELSTLLHQSFEERGRDSEKIKALNEFRVEHIADHKWVSRTIYSAFIVSATSFLFALLKR